MRGGAGMAGPRHCRVPAVLVLFFFIFSFFFLGLQSTAFLPSCGFSSK